MSETKPPLSDLMLEAGQLADKTIADLRAENERLKIEILAQGQELYIAKSDLKGLKAELAALKKRIEESPIRTVWRNLTGDSVFLLNEHNQIIGELAPKDFQDLGLNKSCRVRLVKEENCE